MGVRLLLLPPHCKPKNNVETMKQRKTTIAHVRRKKHHYILSCSHNIVVKKEGINQSRVFAVSRPPRLNFVAVFFWHAMANNGDEVARLQEQVVALQEQLRNSDALIEGTYYATLRDVFESIPSTEYEEDVVFTSLRRREAPSFNTRSAPTTQQLGHAEFTETRHALNRMGYIAAVDSTRDSRATNARALFPTDIFHRPAAGEDLAHLIPHGRGAASTYADVAIWSLGLDMNACWEDVQKAIHGVKRRGHSRDSHTGIKHFITNKACFESQRFLDKFPCVYIIPVMTVEEMLAWNGTEYKAIVMTADVVAGTAITAASVCTRIGMIRLGDVAAPEDIELAGVLLKNVILGMAHWLRFRSEPRVLNTGNDTESRSKLNELRQNFIAETTRAGGVLVPNRRAAVVPVPRVRIVQFYAHADTQGHPAPDPMFLTAKAARNWSQTHGQPLKAAAEPQEEEDGDELDDLALEQYLEWRQDLFRPKTWDDLARGLGQPHGYQERAQEEEEEA
jgi:hypothetical protein